MIVRRAAKNVICLARTFAMTDQRANIKTLVFFDIETTGLPNSEWGRTRITEFSLCAVLAADVLRHFGNVRATFLEQPRIINKVNLCLNPHKVIWTDVTKVTGLDNDLLECYGGFDERIHNIIENFLNHLPSPICLLAHNGSRFDFPILAAELHSINKSLPEGILCADTLNCYRDLYGVNKARRNLFTAKTKSTPRTPVENLQIEGITQIAPVAVASMEACCSINTVNTTVNMHSTSTSQQSNETHDALKDDLDVHLVEFMEEFERTLCPSTPPGQRIPIPVLPSAPRAKRYKVNVTSTDSMMQKINETTPPRPTENKPNSFRLVDLYMFLTECPAPPNLHSAEADALALMQCVIHSAPQVIQWVANNAVLFSTIKQK